MEYRKFSHFPFQRIPPPSPTGNPCSAFFFHCRLTLHILASCKWSHTIYTLLCKTSFAWVIFGRFIYVLSCISNLFFGIASFTADHHLLTCSLDGLWNSLVLGCKVARNIKVFFTFIGTIPVRGATGHRVDVSFILKDTPALFLVWLCHVILPGARLLHLIYWWRR